MPTHHIRQYLNCLDGVEQTTIDDDDSNLQHRTLRLAKIITWVPALGLLFPRAIAADALRPVLSMLATTLSSLLGLAILVIRPTRRSLLQAHVDVLLAPLLFGVLLADGLKMASESNPRAAMLAAYGTVPLGVNFCVHVHFATQFVQEAWRLHVGGLSERAAGIPTSTERGIWRIFSSFRGGEIALVDATTRYSSVSGYEQLPPDHYEEDAREAEACEMQDGSGEQTMSPSVERRWWRGGI